MLYTQTQAREKVIEAGHRLIEAGLIARTWGNISARISDTQFVITPSGLAYETLQPRQLVVVNIADCAYEGAIKPSSEKGIHADAYRLRPDVNFVIHTHQENASIVGITGSAVTSEPCDVLGGCTPCAQYGLSSTKKLRRAVTAAATAHPQSTAVLMRHHGALCMGTDLEHAFTVADALEKACAKLLPPAPAAVNLPDYGSSDRMGRSFRLLCGGNETVYDLEALPPSLSLAASIHAAIYKKTDAASILYTADPDVAAVSARGGAMRPYLDDLAQIAGVSLRSAKPEANAILHALRGRNAVLVQGAGALCTGATKPDAEAARILLEKDCRAERFAQSRADCRTVGALDAWIERMMYVKKYAKKKQ